MKAKHNSDSVQVPNADMINYIAVNTLQLMLLLC